MEGWVAIPTTRIPPASIPSDWIPPVTRWFTTRLRTALGLGMATLLGLAGVAWWYTFVAGAPQLDAQELPASKDLHFREETFPSPAMGQMRSYGLILPPGYDKEPKRRYPVIVLLHGGHDNGRAYYDKYAITSVLDQLYAEKKLEPSLIVTPDGNDNRGSSPLFDPAYADGPNGKISTLIGSDLVGVIQQRYRTRAGAGNWALGGFSSGGWGALNIGLRHLDHFGTLFSHDGYYVDTSGPRNSPNLFIRTLPSAQLKPLRIYLDVGRSDPNFLSSSEQFAATLQQLGISHVFNVYPGGHGLTGPDVGWNYIRKHLRDSLTFVGRSFEQTSPPLTSPPS
jgi:enterochelin esterase-like enzyme